ncbi:hypothetical protein IGI04_012935 [Brassica rapa subsp. trilocularis]|uniref:FAD-binding PCMH-type domain-containing protein n=1 Tax=Brassica rapa subsp. trilocularis TaxID=1813537 RepID=A0ABQ7N7D3_BRACM|nr:hypothetical protein IGI04_012935 [Brassica rapa subsp. trilocularis]
MRRTCVFSVVFFLLFLSLPLPSLSQPSHSVYNSFLKCFSKRTKTPQPQIAKNVFSPTNPAYSSVLRAYIRNARFNTSSTPKPTIIVTPRSYSHVSAAVLCSKPLNFVFKIRSGGHDYDGLSYISDKPFFVLDMSNIRDVSVDVAENSAWISAGATLGEYMAGGAVDIVHKWQFVGPKTDRNLFMRMLIQPVTRNKVKTVRASVVALFLGKADDVVSLLSKELPELALKKENCTEMTWFQSALWWDNRVNATQTDPKVFLDRNLDSSSFGKRNYKEGEVYGRMYFGKNFDRLVKIKTKVDPRNFFRNEQSIPTLPRKRSKRIISTMIKTQTFVSVLLSLFFFYSLPFSSLAAAPSSASVYESFVQCFSDKTKSPQAQVAKNVFSPTNPSYSSVLRAYIRNARFNTSSTPKPTIIVTPRSYSHVSAAVLCSKPLNFVFKIRSGGHDYDGLSYISDKPFFILDMSNLRDVTVNITDQTAWISAGATLGEVYYGIWRESKVHGFPAGVCPTVGVGGHLSGGGYGNMVRKYGLSVDYVEDAKIVDVKGRVLDRKAMGEDLFWAISGGGGGSFGVVLGYKIRLVLVPPVVTVFRVEQYMDSGAVDMVHKWQFVGPKTDRNLFMRMLIQPTTKNKVKTVRASVVALFLGGADDVVSLLAKEFAELGLKKEACKEMTWIQSALWWDNDENATQTDPKVFLDRNLDSASFGKRNYKEGKVYGRKYFGKNFDRLVKIKTAVDPDNFFRNEQSIPTLPRKA